MAKLGSSTKAGQSRKGKSKLNYMDVPVGTPLNELVKKYKSKPSGTIAEISQQYKDKVSPEVLSADEVIQEVSDVTGELPGETRTRAQQDPVIYQEVQDYAGQAVNLASPQEVLGVGGNAQGHQRDSEYSKVGRYNALGQKMSDGTITPDEEAEFVSLTNPEVGAKDQYGATKGFNPADANRSLRGDKFAKDKYTYQERLDMGMESWNMGRTVAAAIKERFEFGLSREEESKISQSLAEQGIEPRSFKEWMYTQASNYAQLTERGVPEALSDLALHAVLQVTRENMRRSSLSKEEAEATGDISPQQKDEEARKLRAGDAQRIGRYMEAAMGIQSTDTTAAIAGTFAQEAVTVALNKGDIPLFQRNDKGQVEFNPDQVEQLEGMQDLTAMLLPQARKEVRTTPINEAGLFKNLVQKASGIKAHRKADKAKRKAGKYRNTNFLNKTTDTLNNQGHGVDKRMTEVLNILAGAVNQDTGGSMIDGLIDIKINDGVNPGVLNNREALRQALDKEGKPILNPKYVQGSVEFNTKFPYVMERYLGNTMKDLKFNETMDWAEQHGNNVIYYDYFVGSNYRFYVEQTVGNPQSDKLARSLLQSAKMHVANITKGSKDILIMKAGIMKKAGMKVDGIPTDKMNVAAAAAAFDRKISEIEEALNGVYNGSPEAFIKLATSAEKWMTISAMVEGVRLNKALKAAAAGGNTQFTTNFYTEIDGVANGLGHNSMQAGDAQVAKATKLSPLFDAIYTDTDPQASGDVYFLAGEGMRASLKKSVNENSAKVLSGLGVMGLNDPATLRSFSKSPLMIFGYGAGKNKIIAQVGIGIEKILNKNSSAGMREALEEALGDVTLKQFKEQMGKAMIEGVDTNFPQIKELSSVLSKLAVEAINQGIDPSVVTLGGHAILFGLNTNQINEELSFTDQGLRVDVKERIHKAAGRTKKVEGRNFSVEVAEGEMMISPWWDETQPESKYNQKMIPAGALKAATQAAVLMTHANDAINIGMSFNELAGKVGGFQIFDGVLVSPLQAKEMADQLNSDFVKLNKEKSNLQRFMVALEEGGMKMGKLPSKLKFRISALEEERQKLITRIRKVNQFFWDDE